MTCSISSEVVPVNLQYKHVKERDHLETRLVSWLSKRRRSLASCCEQSNQTSDSLKGEIFARTFSNYSLPSQVLCCVI